MNKEVLSAREGLRGLLNQFATFGGVGAIGFLVDSATFLLMTSQCCGWSPLKARLLSAYISLTVTWVLNRRFTFRERISLDARSEYIRYLIAQIVGLLANLSIFGLCIAFVPTLRARPFLALCIGASVALVLNFTTARTYAFRADERQSTGSLSSHVLTRARLDQ